MVGVRKTENETPHQVTTYKGIERSPQLRGDRSVAVAIGDCWLWLIMAENDIFKGNYRTKTNICDSK